LSQGIKKVKELKVQDSNIGKGENGNITTNILTFSIKKNALLSATHLFISSISKKKMQMEEIK